MNLLKRASIIIAAVSAAFVGFTERIASLAITFILSAFPAEPMRLAAGGPSVVLREDRPSLASSLLERLRHEKGVPRLGAARNI